LHRGSAFILALALIGGPILCGAVFFLAEAPAQTTGAYVGVSGGVYRLPDCVAGASPANAVSSTSPVVPGELLSFFLVVPDGVSDPAPATSATLFLTAVNHAEPQADYGRTPLPTTVRRMARNVYRVTSDQTLRWDSRGPTGEVYRQALAGILGNRATTELLLVLEVPALTAGSCRYGVTLGPPPALPDIDVKWFAPPAGGSR
jgi:hypothetical protein